MKVAILAGGVGSRLSEETVIRPKPMVEIGGMPILWHIMSIYAHHGFKDFVVALGYKGDHIKRFFLDYCSIGGSLSVDLQRGTTSALVDEMKPGWRVDLVDTGFTTNTGGRIKRLGPHIGNEPFMLTWGDGVADIDVPALLAFHRSHGKLATLTTVHPVARFGHLELDGERVVEFSEKPQTKEGWINGAFFVLEPEVMSYIDGDHTQFEHEPMQRLAREGQLMAYKHTSFWQCMDTAREKQRLEELWATGHAPWKVW